MAFVSKKNNAYSKIATVGGINNSDNPVTFSVTTGDGTKFPAANFKLSADDEIMLVTSRTGDSLTATRAQEGTTIASHSQNADVELRITSGTLGEYEDIFDKTKTTSNAEDVLLSEQASTPTNPAAGYRKIYPKTDGIWYALNSSGTETPLSNPIKATAAEVATGTEDAKFTTPLSVAPYANNSMSRQAIINGNFDVWQRGTTSATLVDDVAVYTADRFLDFHSDGTGTLPTLTRSRQILISGDIPNAFYYSRLTTDGAGSSLGAGSLGIMEHRIEHGTRFLAGDGKKITLSFWAKSDIANKKLGVWLRQNYGTTGSPTAAETINGTNWTLTSTWTKYTHTFTTNTLAGKTFGTSNNDFIDILFNYMWGTTYQTQNGASGAETYVGAGNIDIAQVQLCAGDVALPFQPKSFEEELRACRRFCRVYGGGSSYERIGTGYNLSTTTSMVHILFDAAMRIKPELTIVGNFAVYNSSATVVAVTGQAIDAFGSSQNSVCVVATVASGLTQGAMSQLFTNNSTDSRFILDAEL